MSDGLIEVPERSRAAPLAPVVVGMFLLVLAGTGLVDTLFPASRVEPVGAEKEVEDQRRERARFADGSLAKLVERDLRLSSRVRKVLGGAWAGALFRAFREAKGSVLIGPDEWLFLRNRVDPPDYPARELTSLPAVYVAALQRRLAGLGMEFVIAPIPRKAVLHADALPRGARARPEIDRAFYADLKNHGVTTADLFEEYAGASGDLYSKTDSHWTQEAQMLAARAICKRIGAILVPGDRATKLIQTDRPADPPRHDLLEYIDVRLSAEEQAELRIADAPAYLIYLKDAGPAPYEQPKEMTRMAVVGTSFTARRRLVQYIEHFSGERVWNGAKEAMPLFGSAYDFLIEHRGALPQVFVFEMPISQIFGERELWQNNAAHIFAEFPPSAYTALVDLGLEGAWSLQAGAEPAQLGTLPLGVAPNTGDGVVALRVVGECSGDPAVFEVNTGFGRLRFEWLPGRTELVLPWLAPEATAEPMSLWGESAGASELRITSVEVVSEVDPERRRALAPLAPQQVGEGWVQRFEIGPERIPSMAAWIVRMGLPEGSPVPLRLVAESADPGRGKLEIEFRGVRSEACVVINLGRFEGSELATLEILGSGTAPEMVVESAWISPLVKSP